MKQMKKTFSLALVVLAMLGLLSGCNQNGSGTTKKDTITFISFMRNENFDPVSGQSIEKTAMHSIFDTLVAFAPDGSIVPMLAESWEESEDGLSITFKLRQNVKFHNGDTFTADDVIYTFDNMFTQPYYYTVASEFGGYEKIDDYTVQIDKAAPYSKMLELLAEYSYIVPKEYHSKNPANFTNAPVGAGPYEFVSLGEDDSVTLKAFEDYYGDAPGFKNAVIKAPLEPANMVIALETGEADMLSALPTAQASLVEANDELTLVTESGWSCNTVLLMQEPFKSDSNLRKAIFHGVNRENAIMLGNEGIGTPSVDMLAERIMGEYSGTIKNFTGYDEALAKEYLAKSNYNNEELVLTIYGNAPLAESIQSDLNSIGLNIKIEQLDRNSWSTKLRGGEIQMTIVELGGDTLAPASMMSFFSTANQNYGCHMASNDEFEQLLSDMPAMRNKSELDAATTRMFEIAYDMANIVPLFDASFNYSYGSDVIYDCPVSAPTYVFYLARVMPAK